MKVSFRTKVTDLHLNFHCDFITIYQHYLIHPADDSGTDTSDNIIDLSINFMLA